VGDGSTNEAEPGGLHHSDYPGIYRRASVPGDPQVRRPTPLMGMVKSQTDQAITIGGEPARLLNMQCPAGSGFLVEIATSIHDGTAYMFTSQNPTGSGNQNADRAAFRTFLAGVRLQP
jgi:hypothetical protein